MSLDLTSPITGRIRLHKCSYEKAGESPSSFTNPPSVVDRTVKKMLIMFIYWVGTHTL